MENFINTAALVKTFTENTHLKILKGKGVKTKDITTAFLENSSQDSASTRKIMHADSKSQEALKLK